MQCQVCRHPRVVEINGRLLAGESQAQIAREYGLSDDSVFRHWKSHIPDAIRQAADAQGVPRLAVIEGEVLLGQAGVIYERARALLESLDRDGVDARARVYALREVRACLETLAKLNAHVAEQSKGAVAQAESSEIDRAIVRALEERVGHSVNESGPPRPEPAEPRAIMPHTS